MPKPYKLTKPCPIPPCTKIEDVDGTPHVRVKVRGKLTLCKVSKDGTKYLQPSKRWYFDIRDRNGTVTRVKGYADLKATEQHAADLARKAERRQSGFSDPAEEHIRRPLADHLKDYAAHLETKGGTAKHTRETVTRITAILSGCGFAFPPDLDAGKISVWLADQRRPGQFVEIPAGDAFSSSTVAKLLGVTVDAVRRFVARHRLPTVNQGPARKLLRASVEAIAERTTKGVAPNTVNHYIRAVRGFTRWLVRTKRIGSNPLDTLQLVNATTDVRRARRELAVDELLALLSDTRASKRTFRELTGEDRFFLYLVAAGTGFRSNALANLTPADFALDVDSPTVTLPARFNKSRKTKVQPLPADVAAELRDYLTGKPTNSPVWGGTWAKGHAGAEMLRRDLEAVGIPYAVEGPDGPEYADFHALRHTFLTMLGRHGVDLRTAQELAGHSTPLLTARYSHRRLHDLAGAVDKLPNLVPTSPDAQGEKIPLRSTGTEGAKGVVPGVVTGGMERHQSALKYTFGIVGGTSDLSTQPLEMTGAGASQHRPASICTEVGDLGFEPRLTESESVVLPLHQSPNFRDSARLTWTIISLVNFLDKSGTSDENRVLASFRSEFVIEIR